MSSKEHTADLLWIQKILSGDGSAWNDFVDRFSDKVWRRCWQLCNESCPYNKATVFCVFHALAQDSVAPAGEERPGCDEGLEIYAFIFDYFYNRDKKSGKLKHYDGRSSIDTFVSTVLHGNLRTDWIRHKRKLRVDQITRPEEIRRLADEDGKVFEQMVMQRPTEIIARNLGMSYEDVEYAQSRVTHALMANGNLHLVLRFAEGPIEALDWDSPATAPRVIPMKRSVDRLWDTVCALLDRLPDSEKILLDMAFSRELGAETILEQCLSLNLSLPVKPRTGNVTIHSVYQSLDAILRKVGVWLSEEHADLIAEAHTWLDDDTLSTSVSVKGLKAMLKNMGITPVAPDVPLKASGDSP